MAIIRLEEQENYKDWLKNTNNSWQHDANIQASTDENPFIYLTNTGEDEAIFQVAISKLVDIQLSGENSVLVASSIFDKTKGIKIELRDQSQNILATSKTSLNSKTWTYLLANAKNITPDTTELWITFVLPAGASTVISAIYGQITTQPQVVEVSESTPTILIVGNNETVQQVLDKIEDASEEKKYLVLVPSGHETEYFEWKKYVTVKFLDNLDERWQLDELEDWNNLNSWIIPSGFIASIEQTDEGDWIKLTSQTGSRYLEYAQPLDLRKYQGLLVRFKFTVSDKTNPASIRVRCYFPNNAGWIDSGTWSNMGAGDYDKIVFLPFSYDSYDFSNVNLPEIDWSSVTIRFYFTGNQPPATVYVSSFMLVRTFPYPCVFLRTDDSYIKDTFRVDALREFIRRKYPAIWAIIAREIYKVSCNASTDTSAKVLYELQQSGYISIVNHSFSHPHFDDLDERDTLSQVSMSRYIFERLGLRDALNWWANPYGSTNSYLEKYLKELGYMSVYSKTNPVPVISSLSYDDVPDSFYPLKKGGIVTLLFHASDVDSEEKFNELLSKIDTLEQYSRFVGIKNLERLMNSSQERFLPRQTEPALYETLDSDFTMYFYHKQLFLDPNGTDRNINVQTYELRPGDTFLIVNTGASGNLVFDPSGANITISPSSSIKVVYTGEGWVQI